MKTVKNIKNQFPLLKNSDCVYLDSGATAQKPDCVIDAISNYYKEENANPNRGSHFLSVLSTNEIDKTREKVRKLLNARSAEEIIFTKNATDSLNLVAHSYGENLKAGDEVVLSIMEHHSNLVPWQQIAKKKRAKLKYLYIDKKTLEIPAKEIEEKITGQTKVVAFLSTSNVLGTKNDVAKIVKKAHSVGAVVIVDATQSIAHEAFDVQKTDADFVAFSAHKIYGPMGVGVLYGKKELLEKMSPYVMGGHMIEYVYEDRTTFAGLPDKFEAGTQDVAAIVGFGKAIDFINEIGYKNIEKHEKEVIEYAYKKLSSLPFITLYAPKDMSAVLSFNVKNVHPHDVATFLDMNKICVRSGQHCAQPLLRYLGIDSTVRLSVGVYNEKEDIDKLVEALKKLYEKFSKYFKE
ncbi:MAG: SufS family cysteine desulfurase [Clostridia bacterium]|nr:SufS family cysteine desulfurase [Clostridia bacterium]